MLADDSMVLTKVQCTPRQSVPTTGECEYTEPHASSPARRNGTQPMPVDHGNLTDKKTCLSKGYDMWFFGSINVRHGAVHPGSIKSFHLSDCTNDGPLP